MKKKIWSHKRYGKKQFTGKYEMIDGDRSFILTPLKGGRKISQESHQAALADKWKTR